MINTLIILGFLLVLVGCMNSGTIIWNPQDANVDNLHIPTKEVDIDAFSNKGGADEGDVEKGVEKAIENSVEDTIQPAVEETVETVVSNRMEKIDV
jgi:hypothetical protein